MSTLLGWRLMKRHFAVLLAALPGWWGSALAQGEASADLSPIVVTATRVAESSFDVPASIDVVDRAAIRDGQLQENISESLMTVPGVSAENRQNYAQDEQLSVRGFGARSSSACAACAFTPTVFREPCRTGRASSRDSIWVPPAAWRCCADRSRRLRQLLRRSDIPCLPRRRPRLLRRRHGAVRHVQHPALRADDDRRGGHGQLRRGRRALSDSRVSLSQQGRARELQ